MSEARVGYDAKQPMDLSLAELCRMVESFDYQSNAGPLEQDAYWQEIVRRAGHAWRDETALLLAADLFEVAMSFYDGKINFSTFQGQIQAIMKR